MDGAAMLPLHDMPTDKSQSARPQRRRLARSTHQTARALDSRLLSALADPSRVVFLDVETTGLSWYYDELTIVGWACAGGYQIHVVGDDPRQLLKALASATTLVTFNGTLFDLRFLKKTFGDLALPLVHIDL